MSGLGVWPEPQALLPRGSERFNWLSGQVRTGINGDFWRTREGATVATAVGGPGTYGNAQDAPNGYSRWLRGPVSGGDQWCCVPTNSFTPFLPAMDLPGGIVGQASAVFVFRELIRFESANPLAAGHRILHGFSIFDNMNFSGDIFGAGDFRGIGLVQTFGNVFRVYYKGTAAASFMNLPGLDVSVGRTLVEHRIYYPTPTRIGRYELWINEARVATVQGDDANFPRTVAGGNASFKPLSMFKANGGTLDAGIRSWWGDIISGPDSDGTF